MIGSGLRLAFGLLTVVPVSPPAEITRGNARWAMLLAPLAAAPVCLGAAAAGWGTALLGWPPLLCGLLVLGLLAFGTRAMHYDGLADTVDGLGSGPDREKALRVMKSGDIGPMGTTALILVLGAQAVAASEIVTRPLGWLELGFLLALARGFAAYACLRGIPPARKTGLGVLVTETIPRWMLALTAAILIAATLGIGILTGSWPQMLIGYALAALAVSLLLARCVTRFGGVTGDVIGACIETAATSLLLAAAFPS